MYRRNNRFHRFRYSMMYSMFLLQISPAWEGEWGGWGDHPQFRRIHHLPVVVISGNHLPVVVSLRRGCSNREDSNKDNDREGSDNSPEEVLRECRGDLPVDNGDPVDGEDRPVPCRAINLAAAVVE
jgi:hypothetical protein